MIEPEIAKPRNHDNFDETCATIKIIDYKDTKLHDKSESYNTTIISNQKLDILKSIIINDLTDDNIDIDKVQAYDQTRHENDFVGNLNVQNSENISKSKNSMQNNNIVVKTDLGIHNSKGESETNAQNNNIANEIELEIQNSTNFYENYNTKTVIKKEAKLNESKNEINSKNNVEDKKVLSNNTFMLKTTERSFSNLATHFYSPGKIINEKPKLTLSHFIPIFKTKEESIFIFKVLTSKKSWFIFKDLANIEKLIKTKKTENPHKLSQRNSDIVDKLNKILTTNLNYFLLTNIIKDFEILGEYLCIEHKGKYTWVSVKIIGNALLCYKKDKLIDKINISKNIDKILNGFELSGKKFYCGSEEERDVWIKVLSE